MSGQVFESDLEVSSNRKVNSGFSKRISLRLGKITNIYPDENTADIQWIYPMNGGMSKLELTKPYVGFQSGILFTPEIGSVVTVGFAEDIPILLSYFTPSPFSNMLMGVENNSGTQTRIRKLNPGEISINSIQNAEIYVHDKLEFTDQYGDSIIIDPSDGSINLDSLQLYIDNEAGNITMGQVERNGVIITNDGQPVNSNNGGNALTEFTLTVNQLADDTINSSGIENNAIATVTVGTVVDDSGKITVTQTGKKIVCQINFLSGALIQIDETGNFILNQGNQISPTDTATQAQAQQLGYSGATYTNVSQQRAAREGDRIVIPVTNGQTDLAHPDLEQKATSNLLNFTQLAPMFYVMGIPAVFVPGAPGAQIVGEITQGANGVFIGSMDKNAEQQETANNLPGAS